MTSIRRVRLEGEPSTFEEVVEVAKEVLGGEEIPF